MLPEILVLGLLAVPPDAPREVWVGHQVTTGSRSVPVLGDLETRTDSFFIAEVDRSEGIILLEQSACSVEFEEVMGVGVAMSGPTVRALPRARIRITQERDGSWRAQPWLVAWGETDLDRDGKPGATVTVDSTLCGGSLYVASETLSAAEGRMDNGAFAGHISVEVRQRILGTLGACLGLVASDTEEVQLGRVVYRQVPANTTCASLAGRPWPVRALPVEPSP